MKWTIINLTKYIEDPNAKNYKIHERNQDLNKWTDNVCSWNGISNIFNMSVLSSLICSLKAIPTNSLQTLLKLILEFIRKTENQV